jgi:PKD repeat protein
MSKKLILVIFLLMASLATPTGTQEAPSTSMPATAVEDGFVTYETHLATSEDVAEMMEMGGVYDPDVNYNVLYDGLGTGLAPPTAEEYRSMVGNVRIYDDAIMAPGASLPKALDHSSEPYFPVVRSQGGQGSCTAWACSYYTNGYQQAKDNGWKEPSKGNNSQLMSPAWVYNKINRGYDSGSSFWNNIGLMATVGNCRWVEMPYNWRDLYGWGAESAWRDAPRYRVEGIYDITHARNTMVIKSWLAQGYTLPMALNAGNYAYLSDDGILSATEHVGGHANHANTIVGYNDSITADGEAGAFRIVNSWGRGWGSGWGGYGYYWMTYDALAELYYGVARMYDKADYEPTLLATVNQSQPGSKNSQWYVGTESGLYTNRQPTWNGGSATLFPNFMALDVTELDEDIGLQRYFMQVGAGTTVATVSSYQLEWYQSGYIVGKPTVVVSSNDVPMTAPGRMYTAFELVHLNIKSPEAGTWHRGEVPINGTATSNISRVVFEDDFEGPWSRYWTFLDDNASSGKDFWGNSTERVNSGERSLWASGSDQGMAYFQDFNNGATIPSGWATYSNGPNTYPFAVVNTGYKGCNSYDYVAVANSNRGAGTNITEWLYMTTPLNASSFSNLTFRFYIEYDYYGGDEYANVLFANGSTYPTFSSLANYTADTFGYIDLDLSSQDGEGALYLAFLYHGTNDRHMVVDDVMVAGDKDNHDMNMLSYLYRDVSGISSYNNATLEYDYWLASEKNVDKLQVVYRTSATGSWSVIKEHSGLEKSWKTVAIKVPTNASHLGFRFVSDAKTAYEGAYLDDVKLTGHVDLKELWVSIDGGVWTKFTPAAQWSYPWNSTGSRDGLHNITVNANFNGAYANDSFSLFTDNTPPKAIDTWNDSLTTGEWTQLYVNATDLNEITTVRLYYSFNGEPFTGVNATFIGNDSWNYSLEVPDNATSLDYCFYLEDLLGNGDNSSLAQNHVIDNDLPSLGSDTTPSTATTGDEVRFSTVALDNVAIANITVEYWYGDGQHLTISVEGPAFDVPIRVEDTLEPISYFFRTVDTSGNGVVGETRTIPVYDNDQPTWGYDGTPTSATTGENITFLIEIEDNIAVFDGWVEYWFGSGERINATLNGTSSARWTFDLDIPLRSLAELHYVFRSSDTSDNWAATAERVVTIYDNDLPIFGVDETPSTATTGDPFTFTVEVEDNIEVSTVWFEYLYDGRSHSNVTAWTDTEGKWKVIITTHHTMEPLRYIIHSEDTTGNLNMTLPREVKLVDNDGPLVLSDGSPTSTTTGVTYTFEVLVLDNIGVAAVQVWSWFDGKEPTANDMTGDIITGIGNGTYIHGISIPDDSTDPLYYYFVCIDLFSNQNTTGESRVEVLDIKNPVAVAGGDIVIDQHEAANFSGIASSDNVAIATWTWDIALGGQPQKLEGATPTFVFHDAGAYTVTLTVSDPSGNLATDTLEVTVLDITDPLAGPGDDFSVDQNSNVVFDGSASSDNVGVVEWTWTFEYGGGTVVLDGESPSHWFDRPGLYQVTLRVADAAGNSNEADLTLKVRDTVVPVAISLNNMEASKGDTITFNGTGSTDNVGIVNWTWRVEREGSAQYEVVYGPVAEFTIDEPGDYTVTLTVEDADGNVDTAERFTVHVPNVLLWLTILLIVILAIVIVIFAVVRRRKAHQRV